VARPDILQYDAALVRGVVDQLHTNLATHIATVNAELTAAGDSLSISYPGDVAIEAREESGLPERILPQHNSGVWVRVTEIAPVGTLSGDGISKALHTLEVNTWVNVQDDTWTSTGGIRLWNNGTMQQVGAGTVGSFDAYPVLPPGTYTQASAGAIIAPNLTAIDPDGSWAFSTTPVTLLVRTGGVGDEASYPSCSWVLSESLAGILGVTKTPSAGYVTLTTADSYLSVSGNDLNLFWAAAETKDTAPVSSPSSGYLQAAYLARAVDSTIRSHLAAGIVSIRKVSGSRIPSPSDRHPSVHVIRDTYEVLQEVRTGWPYYA
jgi:hypothetical protein